MIYRKAVKIVNTKISHHKEEKFCFFFLFFSFLLHLYELLVAK